MSVLWGGRERPLPGAAAAPIEIEPTVSVLRSQRRGAVRARCPGAGSRETSMPLSTLSDADLLVALSSSSSISRAVACRLALDLDAWARRPAAVAPLALTLGVPPDQLSRALALLPVAARAASRERERAARLGARMVTAADAEYPAALRHLDLPPPAFALRGELPAGPAVAIVGSRRADPYGLDASDLFARGLAACGVAVVSGFARGVDAAAHRGALAVAGGQTVAVLGCGLGVDYPRGHAGLGDEIAARGALVSEFPCGAGPRGWHFPVRNRLIAALSAGTLVVQAALRSGSLITARHALDLGREVWAVPGRIFDERSLGPNALLRDGARLVQHPLDLLDVLPGEVRGGRAAPSSQPAQPAQLARPLPPGLAGQLLGLLPPGLLQTPEDLAARAGEPLERVLGELLELELAGLVRRRPGPLYGAAG